MDVPARAIAAFSLLESRWHGTGQGSNRGSLPRVDPLHLADGNPLSPGVDADRIPIRTHPPAGSFVNSNGTCLAASNPGLLRAACAHQSVVAPPVYATVAAEMT